MLQTIKDIFSQLLRVKNIGVISAIILLGILMCTFEMQPLSDRDVGVERDIEELCSELTGEKPYVSVNTDSDGKLVGIAVVLKGADAVPIRLKITEMLSTLYAIPSSRVYVASPYGD